MSRVLFWNETDIVKIMIYDERECRYKCNGICFNNGSTKTLGKKCHGCDKFKKERTR